MALFMAQNHTQSSLNVADDSMEISSDAGHPADEEDTLIDIDIDVDAPSADALDERMEDDLEDHPDDLMDDGYRDDATNEEIMDDYRIKDDEEDVELQDLPNEDVALALVDTVDFQNSEQIRDAPLEAITNRSPLVQNNELSNVSFPDPVYSDNADAAGNLDASLVRDSHQRENEAYGDLRDNEEHVVNEEINVTEEDAPHKEQDSNGRQDFETDAGSLAAFQTSGDSQETQNLGDQQTELAHFDTQHPAVSAAAQDETISAQTEIRRPSKAPPLKVVWDGYEFDPFMPDDTLVSFQDLDVAEKPLPEFIGALRSMLRDQIEEELELEIDFRQLGLSLREVGHSDLMSPKYNNANTKQNTPDSSCSLVDVNDIYMSLCNNDGDFDQMPLEITLITRAPFALRYRQLHEAHSSGQGLSTLLPDSDNDGQTDYYEEAAPCASDDEAAEAVETEDEESIGRHEHRTDELPPPDLTGGSLEAAKSGGLTDLVHGGTEDVTSASSIEDFADEVHDTAAENRGLEYEDEKDGNEETKTQKEVEKERNDDIIDYSEEELTGGEAEGSGSAGDGKPVPVDIHGEEDQSNEAGAQARLHETTGSTQDDGPDEEAHGYDEQSEYTFETVTEEQLNDYQNQTQLMNDADYEATNADGEEYEKEEATEYYDAPADAQEEIDYEDPGADAEVEYLEHNGDDPFTQDAQPLEPEHTQPIENESNHEGSSSLETLDDIGDGSVTTDTTTSVAAKLSPIGNASSSTLSRKRSFSQREADGEIGVPNDQKKPRAS